jgi:hypothetical protein
MTDERSALIEAVTREALNKAETALRGGHAIIVGELPHAPWLRTMDDAIEAIRNALAALNERQS